MIKCYGMTCPLAFICREKRTIVDWMVACELLKEAFTEKLSTILDVESIEDKADLRYKYIMETFIEFCDAIDHPYKEEIIKDVQFFMGVSNVNK
jgi:hypothetical protein